MTKGLLKTLKVISAYNSNELCKFVNANDISQNQVVNIVVKNDLMHLFYYS